MINIIGLDKASVIQLLYEKAKPIGPSLGYQIEHLPYEHAALLVGVNIDYVHGRAMKVKVDGPEVDAKRYDESNGLGTAKRVIDGLRERVGVPAKA